MTRRLLPLLLVAALALGVTVPAASATAPHGAATQTTTLLVGVAKADRQAVHAAAGFQVVNRLRGIGVDVVRVPSTKVLDALSLYRSLDGVAFAERNRRVHLTAEPNDDDVDDQYALDRIDARGGWSDYGHLWRRTGGAKLAIVDSGIDRLHPEFENRIVACRSWLSRIGVAAPTCQDSQVHGTHVTGIAAATANNGNGIAGVAFDSPIMALQAFNSAGVAHAADVAAAITYAARNGAKVANYSFSAAGNNNTERRAVEYAARRGVVQVAAAGNTGEEANERDRNVGYPARLDQVIAVSATNRSNGLASYSSRGPAVDVAAPGSAILSTAPGDLVYIRLDGTSMAAPHVAGLAALLRSQGFGPAATRDRIENGAVDLGPDGRDAKFGHGLINMRRSLD